MPTGHDAAAVNDGWRPRRSLWAPVLANLLLGVPALAPLNSAQWLLTEHLPMDCRSPAAIVGSTNCDHHTLDHAGPRTVILLLTCAFVLALAVVVDIALAAYADCSRSTPAPTARFAP
jgi:hypothetical protein